MSSTRNAMIAILFFTSASLHAVTFSSKFSYTESQLEFTGRHLLIARKNQNVISKTPHYTPVSFANAAFQVSGQYNTTFGLYGELGASYPLHGSQIFAGGSLKITPHNFSPYLGLGGYYTTQNNTRLAVGASVAYLGYDLSSVQTGTLFNGYTVLSTTGANAFPTDLNMSITYPVTDRMHSYVNFAYGFNIFNSELPASQITPHVYQSALYAEPSGTTAAHIGDYYGKFVDINLNKISFGIKLNIKEL